MVTKTSHLPIRYFLALLWAHPILHISTIRLKVTEMIQEILMSVGWWNSYSGVTRSVDPRQLGNASPETGDDGVGLGELTECTLLTLATETVLSRPDSWRLMAIFSVSSNIVMILISYEGRVDGRGNVVRYSRNIQRFFCPPKQPERLSGHSLVIPRELCGPSVKKVTHLFLLQG